MRNPAAISARAALFTLSIVAAWSLARCFVGPGEVVPALAAAAAGDLTILGATYFARRSRSLGALLAALGPLLVVMVPVWIVLGGATTWGWPTFSTWHVVGLDLSHGWSTFNALRSPVPEIPGFSLVGAWAVGGAALLAGWAADGGDTPLWVVAPPSAIFLFTSALGTSGWRPLAITAEVAALGWYAASARAARRRHTVGVAERVVAAGRQRVRRSVGVAWPAAIIVVISALLGGLVGPRLPGALSPALVSLRNGNAGASALTGELITQPTGQISIDTLVQVAESEIFQSTANFFIVQAPSPEYTILTTLDTFDGDRWSSSRQGVPLGEPLQVYDVELPAPQRVDGGRDALVGSQIQIQQLGGSDVPAAAVPFEGNGPGTLTYDAAHATLTSAIGGLGSGMTFDVVSKVPLEPASDAPASLGTLTPALAYDTMVPAGMPQQIVALAHQLVVGDTTDYEKAADLERYFQSGAFHYSLPPPDTGAGESVSGGEGLQDLVKFLFDTRTGFCQQFASAYAVLARIDGLPTRIAVGFTPGKQIGSSSTYEVTGTNVHAWPQVYLGGDFGWTSFEPTPGSSLPQPPLPPPSSGTTVPPSGGTGQHPKGATGPLHNVVGGHQPGSGGAPATTIAPISQPAAAPAGDGGEIAWLVIAGLLVLLLGAAPATRLARRRRAGHGAGRVVTAWWEAVNALTLIGLYQHDGETHDELVRRVGKAGALPDAACGQLAALARHTTGALYAPVPPTAEVVREAVRASRAVCAAARRSVSPWRRGWAAVDPRGVLRTFANA